MTTFDLVADWLGKVSPAAFLAGLVYASWWANNLTRTTQDQQQALIDTNKALLDAVNRQAGIEKRLTVMETDKRHMEDSLDELPKIRQKLTDIEVLLARAAPRD